MNFHSSTPGASIRSHLAAAAAGAADTMGARSRSNRRQAASADQISGLCDDVLVRILELLPDAGDAVRTGVLSRRWRGLWTRASYLTFDSSSGRSSDERFLDFVSGALAQRAMADDADLKHLAISFAIMSPPVCEQATDRLVRLSTEAAQGWIRHATQSTAKSFVLNCGWYRGKGLVVERPMINLDDLLGSAKLETMHLELGGQRLQLPATAVFASLVDLSLENIELVAGSGHLLARLLSSACCPSLQKLQLRKITLSEPNELLIEASALLELAISDWPTDDPKTMKLKTPSLRVLYFDGHAYLETLGISAPKLEELTFFPHITDHIDVDGELPCVRRLKVELESHGCEDDTMNNGSIHVLRCCTSLTCLEVSLHVFIMDEYEVVDIISGRIPHLLHLVSLTVHVYLSELHTFGVGLAEVLKQCSYLKYLRVHCIQMRIPDGNNTLCNHQDQWKCHQMYLANIQEVYFTGLAGTDCERWFIQQVLAHATQLQKIALGFHSKCRQHNMIDGSMFIPCNGGTWVHHDPLSYEWNLIHE